jgi:hypothetical protein
MAILSRDLALVRIDTPLARFYLAPKLTIFFIATTGFVLGQTAKLRSKVLAASKAETVAFDEIISVDIADGEVNIIVLSADQLQLFVGVSGGLLLTFNIRDIIKNVGPMGVDTLIDTYIWYIQML